MKPCENLELYYPPPKSGDVYTILHVRHHIIGDAIQPVVGKAVKQGYSVGFVRTMTVLSSLLDASSRFIATFSRCFSFQDSSLWTSVNLSEAAPDEGSWSKSL